MQLLLGSKERITIKFIDQYCKENFDDFTGFSVFFRGFDWYGNNIDFVSDKSNNGLFRVTINPENGVILSTSKKLLKKQDIDTNYLRNLVIKFNEYKIAGLNVDSFHNVYVTFFYADRSQLIRVADKKHLPKYINIGDLKPLRDNWYGSIGD